MNTATLQIRSYVRRKPVDPLAEIRAAKTAQLYREVERQEALFRRMERELSRLVAYRVKKELA